MENKLFTDRRCYFMLRDSCVSQLVPIKLDIYKRFDCNLPFDLRWAFKGILQVLITSGIMV